MPSARLHETLARQREQHVVAAECLGAAHALEQRRVTVGKALVQREQVGYAHGGGVARGQLSARKTRLPFVPPKPNELDSATRTGAWRAVNGT